MISNEHSFRWKFPVAEGKEHPKLIEEDSHPQIGKPMGHPSMYQVWLLNDDYTPMDFVIFVIEKVFHQSYDEAHALTMRVHEEGMAACGAFTREVAETKVMQVIDFAQVNKYPLKCIMRKSHEYVIKKP